MFQHEIMIPEETFPGKGDSERIASGTTKRGAVVVGFSELFGAMLFYCNFRVLRK